MDAQLRAQLNQIVRISTAGTVDAYGQRTVSASTLHYARVEERRAVFEGLDKETIRSSHMIIMDNDVTTPTFSSYIWLPGESASTLPANARKPKSIKPCPGEDGSLDHWEVIV